ncbi:DUF2892 domain-containing protein [candidate division KSB1 bacterium]
MKKNVGNVDAIIRIVLGIIFIVLGVLYSKWWFLAAVISIGTAAFKLCCLYKVFGISTCKVEPKSVEEE